MAQLLVRAMSAPPLPGANPPGSAPVEIDPAQPTDAPPGSEDKIAVLAARAALGLSLFHPSDNGSCSRIASPSTGGACDAQVRAATRALPAGISYDELRKGYRVRIKIAGERVYVGMFDELVVAREALDLAKAGKLQAARALRRQ